MNDSASGLSKVLLQVISRDFSKFSPVTFGRMPMPQDDLNDHAFGSARLSNYR